MAQAGRIVGACVAASGCAFAAYTVFQNGKRNKMFTRQEVAAHNTAQDCWIVVDNGVYDVTQWLDKHPGFSIANIHQNVVLGHRKHAHNRPGCTDLKSCGPRCFRAISSLSHAPSDGANRFEIQNRRVERPSITTTRANTKRHQRRNQ